MHRRHRRDRKSDNFSAKKKNDKHNKKHVVSFNTRFDHRMSDQKLYYLFLLVLIAVTGQ